MRIFLTGATGHIGSAVLEALLRAGHQVTALVRDNEKAARVAARGAYPVLGNLADPESYRPAADAQDGYIHTAFDRSGKGVAIDRQAIEALLGAARRPRTSRASGTPRFFIYTSGVWVIGRAPQPVDESAPLAPIALAQWRVAHDELKVGNGAMRPRRLYRSRRVPEPNHDWSDSRCQLHESKQFRSFRPHRPLEATI